jgi:glycyl-tRNA synthetase beta chain
MSDFLLEILSEEIPARMQKMAAENFSRIAAEVFAKNNLSLADSQIESFVTPCRLVLYVSGLELTQKTSEIKKVGPKITADSKAVEGFLRSVGLSDKAELQQIENNGQACYLYIQPSSEIKTSSILKTSLPQILQKMTAAWPKLMRWDVEGLASQAKWIRPVRNIACMFGSEIIEVEFAGLKSNNLTFVRFEALKLADAADYRQTIEAHLVILDQAARKQKIIEEIAKIQSDLGLKTIDDSEKSPLFDEVAGLCEWPTALLASIDEKFMTLPDEVLILTLKLNQKYFCLKDGAGNLASKFIFIANVKITEVNREKIIKDNEKLVRARLNDAEFFIAEDLKQPLISRLDELKKITFHQKLGSIHDKTRRLNSLAKFLSVFVPHCDLALVDHAIDLCKSDLTTKMVAELPELQGKIGSFYANWQGENNKIAAAIYEHYLPLGPNSELPKTALGVVLSIADKIDSIVGFFLANEKPTSSKDPFGLRRAALGIIRIGFHYNIAFPIRILVERSLRGFPNKLCDNKKILTEEVIHFFVERLKAYLREHELAQGDIINAVIEEYLSDLKTNKNCDILQLAKKIKFLSDFIGNKKNQAIIELYKRSANILAIAEKKDGKSYSGKVSRRIMKSRYELVLHRRIKQISPEFKKLVAKGEFESAFKLLDILEVPLGHFFDHVVVNDADENLRENRLLLLSKIRALFNRVADLSKIEIS